MKALVTALALASLVGVRGRVAPAVAMMLVVTVLLAAGVITTKEALAGFSNPATFTVAALFVVARGVERTGVLGRVVESILGRSESWAVRLGRLVLASAGMSAFLNNTPIVAMLVPPLTDWADARREPASRYLLPMVYAVSVGGTITLIGTSTNIVASGVAEAAGERPFGIFELTKIGLPVALVGSLVLVLTTRWALRPRRAARKLLEETAREFILNMAVLPGGPLDGRSVGDAGLRRLEGVFLVEIARRGVLIAPVGPTTILEGGDELTFVGKADQVPDLQAIRGLTSSEHTHVKRFDPKRHPFYEAVIGPGSPLLGRTLKEVGFRGRYQAAVVAIHRSGERIPQKLGQVKLRAGDTLLFIAEPTFRRNDFLVVSRIGGAEVEGRPGGVWIGGLLLAVVVVAALGVIPLLQATLVGVAVLTFARVIAPNELRHTIDVEVIVTVAASFAIGTAAETSGLARLVGDVLVRSAGALGPRGALLGVTVFAVVMAQFLTCNAAAALAVPLGLHVARSLHIDPRAFLMAATIGASSTYLTPYGYQTKMMVFGPGGYRATDYTRLGLPLTLAVVAAVILLAPLVWPV